MKMCLEQIINFFAKSKLNRALELIALEIHSMRIQHGIKFNYQKLTNKKIEKIDRLKNY